MKAPIFLVLLSASLTLNTACSARDARDSQSGQQGSLGSGIELAPIEFTARQPTLGATLSESLASPFATRALEQAREAMRHNAGLRFQVVGYSDSSECKGIECMELSLRRATAVRSWLIARGIAESTLLPAVGKGSKFPLEPGDSEDSRSVNRRVEIRLVP